MKISIYSLIAATFILALFGFATQQKDSRTVVLVKAQYGYGVAPALRIYRGTAPVESIDLSGIKSKESTDAVINKAMETVNNFIAEGYEVIAVSEAAPVAGFALISFTLKK